MAIATVLNLCAGEAASIASEVFAHRQARMAAQAARERARHAGKQQQNGSLQSIPFSLVRLWWGENFPRVHCIPT